MKKIISALLCVFTLLSLTACNKKSQSTTSDSFTPTKLNVYALYDITACSLAQIIELNAQAKLKGNYNVSLYQSGEDLINSNDYEFGIAITTLSNGVALCNSQDYIHMLSLASCNVSAFSNKKLNKIKDFEGKKVLVFDDSDLIPDLNAMLTKASVNCAIKATKNKDEFLKLLKSDKYDIAVAAYPTASEIPATVKEFKNVLSLNDEWDRVGLKGKLYTHCIVSTSEVLTEEFQTYKLFLEEYNDSINKLNETDATTVQAIIDRGLNSSGNTALQTCKNNGFMIEDYNETQNLLTKYADNLEKTNYKLSINEIKYK